MDEHKREIKSYVLRTGRMSKRQRSAVELYSGRYCIPFTEEQLNFNDFFNSDELCIEIGFGMGTATAEIAEKNPEKSYLGIEVHKPGVGRLLADIEDRGLQNLKIINYDAVQVLKKMIPEQTVSGFHIFFPDPWPKKKHRKRRLLNDDFTALLASRLKKNGYIYAVTDWEDYAGQIIRVLSANPVLENQFELWAEPPDWRPVTAFEKKGIDKNHIIREIYFRRL